MWLAQVLLALVRAVLVMYQLLDGPEKILTIQHVQVDSTLPDVTDPFGQIVGAS